MKYFSLWMAVALLPALAGCAQQGALEKASPETRSDRQVNVQARIHTELGAGYFARGQYAIALQELNIARAADPGYAPAYSVLGLVHAELREDRQAEENFRRAIDLAPNYSEAHNNYGLFLCQRGRAAESLARFEAALSNPLYATPETALANAGVCLSPSAESLPFLLSDMPALHSLPSRLLLLPIGLLPSLLASTAHHALLNH
jgi:type IV pilus assembly protein PilF